MSQPEKQSSGGDATVVIGKGMIIKGRMHSEEDVFLNGEMEGELDIENYRLTGDVKTRGIVIEEGALFKGNVEILARPEPVREARNGE